MLTIDIQEAIHVVMMYFDWNNGKNELLKKERNGSFEEVILALEKNRYLCNLVESTT